MYFGVISPKIKTATVTTAVEITAESTAGLIKSFANKIVAIADAERFTMLFPRRIVLKRLSKRFSARSRTLPARLFPFVKSVLSLIFEAHEYAVSVAEKNPERKIRAIREINKLADPAGIKHKS